MAKVQEVSLSAGDVHILNSVFDPESGPSAPSISIDPSLPPDPHIFSPGILSSIKQTELRAIKLIESCQTTNASERHTIYLEALSILSNLISQHPDYASAYNNRAQLRRWRYGDHILPISTPSAAQTEDTDAGKEKVMAISHALADLTTAIALATSRSQDAAVSPSQGRLLANAWTQRGAMFYALSKDLLSSRLDALPSSLAACLAEESDGEAGEELAREWLGWDRMRMEEEGSRCFFTAGAYGSEVGKAMAVVSNPYARLCGAIVREAVRGEVGGKA